MTMQGKICLITGGTNGIGKSSALELARMGTTVVIVRRNAQKTAQVGERGSHSRAYENSKLANILFTVELARRLEGTGVTVNALHPGLIATGFGKNNGKLMAALIGTFMPLVAPSPEKCAQTSIYLASSLAVEGVTGRYFVDAHVTPPAPQATDMITARTLWDVSADMVHLAATHT